MAGFIPSSLSSTEDISEDSVRSILGSVFEITTSASSDDFVVFSFSGFEQFVGLFEEVLSNSLSKLIRLSRIAVSANAEWSEISSGPQNIGKVSYKLLIVLCPRLNLNCISSHLELCLVINMTILFTGCI